MSNIQMVLDFSVCTSTYEKPLTEKLHLGSCDNDSVTDWYLVL